MSLKVVKFGGTSLADANQFRKVADIINSDKSRRYVITSAPGKRFSNDEKITDLLYNCYDNINDPSLFDEIFAKITSRYDQIIKDLGVELSLSDEYSNIRKCMKLRLGRDYVASRGEYLCAIILSKYLGFDFVDAAKIVRFGDDGRLDAVHTENAVRDTLAKHEYAVIPGFYGSMPNDTIRTFSRGGSDISGAIVAGAMEADIYENWTDVSGFLTADPRIVNNPKVIDIITYYELRELSYMGATVLHEDAIFPAKKASVPINIKNTNAPNDKGTFIMPEAPENSTPYIITGIAGKKGFSSIIIHKDMMNQEIGFCRKVLNIFEKRGISVEHMPSGIDTINIVVKTEFLNDKRDWLLNDICHEIQPNSITVEDGLSLIAVVGRGIKNTKGTAYRVLKAVNDAGVSLRMVDMGSGEFNIIVGVNTADFESTIKQIYTEFVG